MAPSNKSGNSKQKNQRLESEKKNAPVPLSKDFSYRFVTNLSRFVQMLDQLQPDNEKVQKCKASMNAFMEKGGDDEKQVMELTRKYIGFFSHTTRQLIRQKNLKGLKRELDTFAQARGKDASVFNELDVGGLLETTSDEQVKGAIWSFLERLGDNADNAVKQAKTDAAKEEQQSKSANTDQKSLPDMLQENFPQLQTLMSSMKTQGMAGVIQQAMQQGTNEHEMAKGLMEKASEYMEANKQEGGGGGGDFSGAAANLTHTIENMYVTIETLKDKLHTQELRLVSLEHELGLRPIHEDVYKDQYVVTEGEDDGDEEDEFEEEEVEVEVDA